MNVSALFIKRPVMTTLIMMGILVFGVLGFKQLPISDLPRVDYPTISVSASLPGASPETMASTVATVLERQFATIAGVDSMNSSSSLGSSNVTLQFSLNRDIDAAAQDVQTAISAAIPLLPPMPTRPSFRKQNPADAPVLFLLISSPTLPLSQVDEYAETLVGQRISMVSGVAQVQVFGSQKYAVRVQIDPQKLSAKGIGIDQVDKAIVQGNVHSPTGTLYGPHQAYTVLVNDQLPDAAHFNRLIVGTNHGAPIYLGDLGRVMDSVENDKLVNWTRGGKGVVLAIFRQPNTNTVQVIDDIKKLMPGLNAEMPPSVHLGVMFDRSLGIRQSVYDVERTMLITIALVVGVIFMFLRNGTATLIPSLALPMSIVGTFAAMALLKFSLDNLSLMALTLCVGFVVDDAIVVLENTVRHMEMGEPPYTAALNGSREVGFTIVSMTTSLVAVFIPILFMGGILGRLFNEFAVTITVAIMLSGFVSLSLTPMLCSRFLKVTPAHTRQGWVYRTMENLFEGARDLYAAALRGVLRFKPVTLILSFVLLGVTWILLGACSKGFIPTTDTGQVNANTLGPQDISFDSMAQHQQQISAIVAADDNIQDYMSSVGGGGASGTANNGRLFMALKPYGRGPGERRLTADQIIQELRKKFAQIPGIQVFMTNPPAIRIGGMNTKGTYQCTVQSLDLKQLFTSTNDLLQAIEGLPGIQDANTDLQNASLQATLTVDRDKAASLGLDARTIDAALGDAYGTKLISTIYTETNEYSVVLDVLPQFNKGPEVLPDLYLHSSTGRLVPLGAVAKIGKGVGPLLINHLGQLPSATISFNLKPGTSLSEAVKEIQGVAAKVLPAGVSASFQGSAQAFQASLENMANLLVVAILVIYIVLGILYESFIHPITILAGLPSAGLGAVLTLMLFHMDLDIYGFLGLILLIGIVKKNAIMMIDHALDAEREHGKTPEEAIYQACLVRFRPIMMTTMAALMGSLPIAIGLGLGSEARRPLGMAVVGGLMISQLLTLFITPVYYIYLDKLTARFGRKPSLRSKLRRALEGS